MYCLACGVDLQQRKGDRRLLSSSSSQHIVPTLLDTAKYVIKKDVNFESKKLSACFVCRPCFRQIEKLHKLQKEVEDVQESLRTNITKAIPYLPLIPEATESESQLDSGSGQPDDRTGLLGRKRELSPEKEVAKSPKRRRNLVNRLKNAVIGPNSTSSPAVSVTVHYPSHPKSFVMTPNRRKMCKPLARGNREALARRCLNDLRSRKSITKRVGLIIRHEIANLCSDKVDSVLRSQSTPCMENFNWETVLGEMKNRAPVLLSLLQSCTKTRKTRKNRNSIIGLIASFLCKHRRPSASLLQRLISVLLYSGHASKKTYGRLQKLNLCMSHWRTVKLLDKLGERFDSEVLKWRSKCIESMESSSLQQNEPSNIVMPISTADDQSSSSDESQLQSPSAVEEPVRCLSSIPIRVIDSPIITSEESPSERIEESSESVVTLHTGTVSSPTISLLTGSHIESDELSSCEKSSTNGQQNVQMQTDEQQKTQTPTPGYKIVIDNIDKNVKPRNMRINAQTKSLHYVHMYSVKDRVDFGKLSDVRPSGEIAVYDLLPSTDDYQQLKDNFAVHVARLMVEHITLFSEDFSGLIPRHLPHQYSHEMSLKSEVIPLGVIPKSETNYEDMMDILEHIHQYVPAKKVNREVVHPLTNDVLTLEDHHFNTILLGGDQLTTARMRGAQRIRSDCDRNEDRLAGVLPVAEDWHAKQCFMQVIWKKLYKTKSGMERGTFYQLRNLINRRNVTASCKNDMNACEEFLELVVTGYVLTAVLEFLGMSSVSDSPSSTLVPPDVWMLSDSDRKSLIMDIASQVVQQHVDLSTQFCDGRKLNASDTVYAYASEALSLGLLFYEFGDAVKEGDGNRLFRVWKYLLLLFKASNSKNYAIEAFTLLAQYHFLLPPHLAEQLKWSRFINVHGFPGHNISCDLHMEHLNRLAKQAIECLGANKSEKAIIRVGKCIGALKSALNAFDKEHDVSTPSGAHSNRSNARDLKKIMNQLQQVKPFQCISGRKHKSFASLNTNMIRSLKEDVVKDWMVSRFAEIIYM